MIYCGTSCGNKFSEEGDQPYPHLSRETRNDLTDFRGIWTGEYYLSLQEILEE
uniref:Uncharacterized protein n=1 Tax=Rhizophagus irregularis (strain DAOM 181602 / DAOM 197198 / MUCL 43194) TaxID=747089 RepID=U9UCK4_RHIID